MIKISASALSSQVARRIFGVFLFCALVPFAGLVIVSEDQVNRYFKEKNHTQLRAMAKIFGMDIFERLTLLQVGLENLAHFIEARDRNTSPELIKTLASNPLYRWINITLIEAKGDRRVLLGDGGEPPVLTAEQKKRLAAGKALMIVAPGALAGAPPRMFMSTLVNPLLSESDILIGEINANYLWNITSSRALPAQINACILNQFGMALRCAPDHARTMPAHFKESIAANAIGEFNWSHGGSELIASYWTIPTRFQFGTDEWVVVLRTEQSGLFAAIGELRNTLLLWVIACVGLSILAALYQIRKQLVPVEALKTGTEKFAAQDFAHRVQVSSRDEFQDLASSMNSMAAQLGRQFRRLETTAAIDRAVLSLLDSAKIFEVILSGIGDYLHCERGTLTLVKDGEPPACYLLDRSIGPFLQSSTLADALAMRTVNARSSAITAGRTADLETSLRSAVESQGFKAWLRMPLLADQRQLGILVFYTQRERTFSAEELEFVSAVTDQAAIAIYNSQLYEQTKQQTAELLKANQAKDDFLSVVSHELRTPLNIILGFVRVLKERMLGDLNAEQEKALLTVNRHSTELLAMVDSIMQATLIQAGKVEIDIRPVELSATLTAMQYDVAVPADKAIALNWSIPETLPTLLTDESRLRCILQHLINNAVKFTESGSVTVTVRHDAESQCVEFAVADTGIGIAASALDKIFELFHQTDGTKTREFGGMGLGLYIVQQLTQLLGGKISVVSTLGAGSVFTLALPLIPVQHHDDDGRNKNTKFFASAGVVQDL